MRLAARGSRPVPKGFRAQFARSASTLTRSATIRPPARTAHARDVPSGKIGAIPPKTALELLRRIQKHRATIGERPYTGIGKTTPEQRDLFAALSLPKP
jgi:hypothetical protein